MNKMTKKAILLVLFSVFAPTLWAQKLLSVEDTTEGIGVYPCGERKEAMVQFVTHETFGLNFESNYDSNMEVALDSVAGTKTYTIIFVTEAPGVDYSGRRVTILAPGFKNFTLPLNLSAKQKIQFTVSDPYSALRSPYFIYQEKANDLFYKGEYQGAKDCYEMIRVCPEYQINKQMVDERIAICDSMVTWNAQAMQFEHFAQFSDAATMYYKMYFYNSSNEKIYESITRARQKFKEDCDYEKVLAEHYIKNNQTELAKACYERIIEKKCNSFDVDEATEALRNIGRKETKGSEHVRCLFYDWAPNQEIGLTFAQCYSEKRRSSGYITFRFSPALFKIRRSAPDGELHYNNLKPTTNSQYTWDNFSWTPANYDYNAEEKKYIPKEFDIDASLSFGWTIRTWRYFFIHFGPGVRAGNLYKFDEESAKEAIYNWKTKHSSFNHPDEGGKPFNSWDDELRHKCSKNEVFLGIAPDAGLIVKVWRLNLKVTYQYTFWFNDEDLYSDFLDDNKAKIGVGFGFNW